MDNSYNNLYSNETEWQSLSTPVMKKEETAENIEDSELIKAPRERRHSRFPVLSFQLTVSLCALLLLFGIKFAAEPLFEKVMTWYETEISKSVIFNGDFENLDFSALFSTHDEAEVFFG